MKLLKKYWDIIGGSVIGISLAIAVNFKVEEMQLIYSIVILILTLIGLLRILKQNKRRHNFIDDLVDVQKPIKAFNVAQDPTKQGEELGEIIIKTIKGSKKGMEKIKEFFDKFKGYLLTFLLGLLTIIEMCGGYINEMLGGVLTVNGIDLLPVITLVASLSVGVLSNGFTKEQWCNIKKLVAASKSPTNDLVKKEINSQVKQLHDLNKEYEKEIASLEKEKAMAEKNALKARNNYEAKAQLNKEFPQITTSSVVEAAREVLNKFELDLTTANSKIEELKNKIDVNKLTINTLKSRL